MFLRASTLRSELLPSPSLPFSEICRPIPLTPAAAGKLHSWEFDLGIPWYGFCFFYGSASLGLFKDSVFSCSSFFFLMLLWVLFAGMKRVRDDVYHGSQFKRPFGSSRCKSSAYLLSMRVLFDEVADNWSPRLIGCRLGKKKSMLQHILDNFPLS